MRLTPRQKIFALLLWLACLSAGMFAICIPAA